MRPGHKLSTIVFLYAQLAIAQVQNPGASTGLSDSTDIVRESELAGIMPAPTPWVQPTCSGTCATAYAYVVQALGTTGYTVSNVQKYWYNASTLDESHYNVVGWLAVTGASSYKVYRTTGGATQGVIYSGTDTSVTDNGLSGDGASVPAASTSVLTNGTALLTGNSIKWPTTRIGEGRWNTGAAQTTIDFDANSVNILKILPHAVTNGASLRAMGSAGAAFHFYADHAEWEATNGKTNFDFQAFLDDTATIIPIRFTGDVGVPGIIANHQNTNESVALKITGGPNMYINAAHTSLGNVYTRPLEGLLNLYKYRVNPPVVLFSTDKPTWTPLGAIGAQGQTAPLFQVMPATGAVAFYVDAAGKVGVNAALTYGSGLIPNMTSATAPSGVASSSTQYDANFAAWKALQSSPSKWSTSLGTNPPHWIQYQFSSAQTVAKYEITATSDTPNAAPYEFYLQASTDGTNWKNLDYQNFVTYSAGETKAYFLSNDQAYAYYRIYIISNFGNSLTQILDWQLYAYSSIATNSTELTVNGAITATKGVVLPSSCSGLASGVLYNNAGTPAICP